ncbi:thioredoxin family protein [Dinghuibacter silviterrae]|uniref:Thioredoxin-like protein n=1 Tax=Dinghuibacter silviterrae TaxID=1539049 RepID=A0A4R8DFX3_9BACT|nr:thioredoxin family protein [Dinghuibacter silviterrae]TDW96511.1 thioredoxin-like protein [Dinghuibacter silviterrae]
MKRALTAVIAWTTLVAAAGAAPMKAATATRPASRAVATPAPAPPSADSVLAAAYREAAATHRKVFVIFHASWCGWCHRMDSIMKAPVCQPLFEKNYVVTHLVILETGSKAALVNPGAMELYTKYAGAQGQGIPFFLIINPDGTVLQDSRIKPEGAAPGSWGNNTGCPDSDEELTYFVRLLHETSTLSDTELKTIRAQFARKS